ncbi:glycosyltransferase family 2 protein [Sporolactobacillus sp. CPB3-1]|uniref:Glycosyltransferase family 2 protein n=1 Tax=Sporolactobacillus mangiferae TaxID=2940498 RepID=A0ABT0M9U2_9BACL|nr:glycosyltransferase family 2 protein [Sporolactobacillus mangiferae]MCL1631646.1 glycosyltransferase family 2 protein [Sporolactobacillus mangiferae]
MEHIAVLIPCYNESLTIEKVVTDFKEALPEATIYVYDNNSTDGTDVIARQAGAVVRYEQKQGKGQVIRRMFREINAECYLMVDGDDTYPAESARDMVQPILDREADMVIGDRLSSTYYTENKRPFHNIGNRLVRQLIKMLFKTDVSDIMTGYRAFNYTFVKMFPVLSKGFEIETEMTIHACDKNLGLKNVTVRYQDRAAGSVSKLNTYSDGVKVLITIFRLFKNYDPFKFFGTISLVLLLISFILALPVLVHYFQTGLVPRFPTLIVSGFLMLASLLSFFGGMILDVLVQNERQNFEIKMNEYLQLQRILNYAATDEMSEPYDQLLAKK